MLSSEEREEILKTLTSLQRKFVLELLNCGNQAEALRRAGSKSQSPHVQAAKLMANPVIREAYEKLRDDAEERECMKFNEACAILSRQARGNISRFLTPEGNIDPSKITDSELSDSVIEGYEVEQRPDGQDGTITNTKLKLGSRVSAIQTLSRLKGWDKQEFSATLNISPMFKLNPLKRENDGGGDNDDDPDASGED